jgi:phage tail sheath protein FI
MTVEGAATAAQGVDSKHAVMVAGWCTYASQPRLAAKSVSPDGFYAGHLAATAAHVSPAARSSSRFFSTVVEVDTESSVQAFNAYTDGRLEAIILDPAANAFHCLNGRTLANDPAHYYVCIRRMSNQIQTDIFFASQPYKSEPKSASLLGNVSIMVNSYLTGLANTNKIKGGAVTGAQSTASGIRIDFRFFPLYPADSIEYGMHRLAVDV